MEDAWIAVVGTLGDATLGMFGNWFAHRDSRAVRQERLAVERRQELVAVYKAILMLAMEEPSDAERRANAERWREAAAALDLLGADRVRAAFTALHRFREEWDARYVRPPENEHEEFEEWQERQEAPARRHADLVAAMRAEIDKLDADRRRSAGLAASGGLGKSD